VYSESVEGSDSLYMSVKSIHTTVQCNSVVYFFVCLSISSIYWWKWIIESHITIVSESVCFFMFSSSYNMKLYSAVFAHINSQLLWFLDGLLFLLICSVLLLDLGLFFLEIYIVRCGYSYSCLVSVSAFWIYYFPSFTFQSVCIFASDRGIVLYKSN
jgi:hypothetical protein